MLSSATLPGRITADVYTLDLAIEQALETRTNLRVRAAIRDGLVAQKEARLAEKAISLDVDGSASGTRYASQFSLGLNKRLYAGRGFKLRVGAADSMTAAADAQIIQERRAIALEVTSAYWNLLAAQLELEEYERLDQTLSDLLATIETRFEQGTVSRRDRNEGRVLSIDTRVLIEEAKGRQRLLAIEFLRSLGAGAHEDLPVVSPAPMLPSPPRRSLSDSIEAALLARPELASLEASVEAREQELVAAKTKNLFTLDISGGYRWRGYDYLVVDQGEAVNSFAYLALIGRYESNWRLNQARASLVETEQRIARLDLESKRTDISWQVARAHNNRETLDRQLDAVTETVGLSEANLQSALAAYEHGRLSVMEVLASHIALTERRIKLHQLESAAAIAAAELEWAAGGTL